MIKKYLFKESNYIPLLIITFSVLIMLILSIRTELTLATYEIEKYYFAKSLPFLISDQNPQLVEYAKINGHFLFFVPLIYLFPFAQFFDPWIYIFKFPNLILGLFLSFLLYSLLVKFLGEQKQRKLIAAIFISLSPWLTTITFYHLSESLSLLFVLAAFLMLLKMKEKRLSLNKGFYILTCLLLSAFSSWTGFFFVFTLLTIFPLYLLRRKSQVKLPANLRLVFFGAYIIFFGITFINKTYIITSLSQNTFIEKLRPSVLATEINERQKVDFLSMNKNFILPSLVRKAIYNKPALALNKVVGHAAGIIDFEHWAFPFESYDQLRASGILPKGNLPPVYFFDIPLITFGLYLLIRNRKLQMLFPLLIAAFVPYLIFEKRDLIFSGVFFLPLVLASETVSLIFLIKRFNELNGLKRTLVTFLAVLIIIPSLINFHVLFFFDQEKYERPDQFLYRDIASWILDNKNDFQKIIVTDRFGPTHLTTAFYLNLPPKLFWENYFKSQDLGPDQAVVKIENMEFRAIDWTKENKYAKTVYVGFIGEFAGPSENMEAKGFPKDAIILKEIPFSDELVWLYGKKILFVKPI